MKTKKITFTDFEIRYDGIYKLIVEKMRFKIYLSPAMLLSLFESEGYGIKEIKKLEDESYSIPFKKTSISLFKCIYEGEPDGWLTSEGGEQYQHNDLYLLEAEIG